MSRRKQSKWEVPLQGPSLLHIEAEGQLDLCNNVKRWGNGIRRLIASASRVGKDSSS